MSFNHRRGFVLCLVALVVAAAGFGFANTAQAQIVALGASNVAGRGVSPSDAFPAQLERMLAGKGYFSEELIEVNVPFTPCER